MNKELEKYNSNSSSFNIIKIAINAGWIDFGHNEWANKDEIRRLCNCKELTPRGFVDIKKEVVKKSWIKRLLSI